MNRFKRNDCAGRRRAAYIAAAVAAASLPAWAPAASSHYVGNGTSWNSPTSWSGGAIPANGDTAWVTGAISVAVPFDATYTAPGLDRLIVDGKSGATITIVQSSAVSSLHAAHVTIGEFGSALYSHGGGTNVIGSALTLGAYGGSSGTYSMNGFGNLSVGGSEIIGDSGNGAFNQNGTGTHSIAGNLVVGHSSNASGRFVLGAGDLIVGNNEYIGFNGVGTFEQSGTWDHTIGSNLYVGYNGTTGTYILSGDGRLIVGSSTYVGFSNSTGTFYQYGLPVHSTQYLSVGAGSLYRIQSGPGIRIGAGFDLDGMLDVRGSVTLSVTGGIVDLAHGTLSGPSALIVTGSANSLIIFPAGFDPATKLRSYSTTGITGNAGSAITIPSGTYIVGQASVSEHLIVNGSLSAPEGGWLNLENGVSVAGGGSASVTTLIVSDATSSLADGGILTVEKLVNRGIFDFTGGSLNVQAVEILAGGRMTAAAGAIGTLRVDSLTIDELSGSTLDLCDNDLVVNSGEFSEILALVLAGFGNSSGGITSSTSTGVEILALFDNALVGAGDWEGVPINANAIVGKYTYFGDVNLDGQLSGDDYTIIDSNLDTDPAAGIEWLSGDANLDGVVTGDDYTIVDSNLGLGNGNPLVQSSSRQCPNRQVLRCSWRGWAWSESVVDQLAVEEKREKWSNLNLG